MSTHNVHFNGETKPFLELSPKLLICLEALTLPLLNKLPHPLLIFNQSDYFIHLSRLMKQIHIPNDKRCRFRSVGSN